MSKEGKVNSTCCRVHKDAELVPDSAGIRMYVRTTIMAKIWTTLSLLLFFQKQNLA